MSSTLHRVALPLLLAAALTASPAAIGLALAHALVPFHATFAEQVSIFPCPPNLCATATGTGVATHLGQTTETVTATVTGPSATQPGCFSDSATGKLTAANGDTVAFTAVGTFCPAAGIDSGTYVVTGGTGRFLGASGSGTFLSNFTSPTTSTTAFDGVLSSPGAIK